MRYCIVKTDAGGVPEALVPYCQITRHYTPERRDISKHQIRIFSTGMLFTIISQLAPFIHATELAGEPPPPTHTHTQTQTHVHAPAHCTCIGLQGKSCSEVVHRPTNKCSHWFISWPWLIRSSRCLTKASFPVRMFPDHQNSFSLIAVLQLLQASLFSELVSKLV